MTLDRTLPEGNTVHIKFCIIIAGKKIENEKKEAEDWRLYITVQELLLVIPWCARGVA